MGNVFWGLIAKKTSILLGLVSIFLAGTGLYITIGVKNNLEPLQTDIHSLQITGGLLAGRLEETDKRITSLGRGPNSVAVLVPTAGGCPRSTIQLEESRMRRQLRLNFMSGFQKNLVDGRDGKSKGVRTIINLNKDGFIRFHYPKISLTYPRIR